MHATHALDDDRLPEVTIQAVARGFFREADSYGFRTPDYVRFMSALLDITNNRIGAPAARPFETAGLRTDDDDGLVIRPFDPAETDVVELWLEDRHGRHFLPPRAGGTPTFAQIVADPHSVLGTVTLADGTPIGITAYLDYDPEQRKAELRKLIGVTTLRGRGYGKAATRLWLRYGFESLNLHKIYLTTLNTNLRNIRLNEGLGFRLEGILRDELLIDGQYHDVLRMAIRSSDAGF